jgi:hypothetical protein
MSPCTLSRVAASLEGFWERQQAREKRRHEKQRQLAASDLPVGFTLPRQLELTPYLAGLHPYRTPHRRQRFRRVR